jgi:hypothetical protein
MRIVILFDRRMEYLWCFIGLKKSHPKPNWMAIYLQFSLAQGRMRRPLIGAKGFRSFHWTRGNKLKGVMEAHQERRHGCMGKKEKEEENEV